MKKLVLTQGKTGLVDDDVYEREGKHKWLAHYRGNSWYVLRRIKSQGRWKTIHLHREIMNAPKGMVVDHINGNGLDNRRSNLRLATHGQNIQNSRFRTNNTSGFKGVVWRKDTKKWQAQITVNGKYKQLGVFADPTKAARVYDAAARKYHGKFAKTNFN